MTIANRWEIDQLAGAAHTPPNVVLARAVQSLDTDAQLLRNRFDNALVQLNQTTATLGNVAAKVERLGRLIQYVHEVAPEVLRAAQIKDELDQSVAGGA